MKVAKLHEKFVEHCDFLIRLPTPKIYEDLFFFGVDFRQNKVIEIFYIGLYLYYKSSLKINLEDLRIFGIVKSNSSGCEIRDISQSHIFHSDDFDFDRIHIMLGITLSNWKQAKSLYKKNLENENELNRKCYKTVAMIVALIAFICITSIFLYFLPKTTFVFFFFIFAFLLGMKYQDILHFFSKIHIYFCECCNDYILSIEKFL